MEAPTSHPLVVVVVVVVVMLKLREAVLLTYCLGYLWSELSLSKE